LFVAAKATFRLHGLSMPDNLEILLRRRDALKRAIGTGAHSVSIADYQQTFRSIAEIQAAIKDVDTDIADLQGTKITRTYRFTSQKGL
jgi:hypothetical protein